MSNRRAPKPPPDETLQLPILTSRGEWIGVTEDHDDYPRGIYRKQGAGELAEWVLASPWPYVRHHLARIDRNGRELDHRYALQVADEEPWIVHDGNLSRPEGYGASPVPIPEFPDTLRALAAAIRSERGPARPAVARWDENRLIMPPEGYGPAGWGERPGISEAHARQLWRDILDVLSRHPRAAFIVSAAFGGLYVDALRRSAWVLNVNGVSSQGKSTALYAAASLFGYSGTRTEPGGTFRTWDSTAIGMMRRLGSELGVLPAIVDELGTSDLTSEAQARQVFRLVAGGVRTTGRRGDQGTNESAPWQSVLISSANVPLADGIERDGLLARLVELPGPIFQPADDPGAAEDARSVERWAREAHGWPFHWFLTDHQLDYVAGRIAWAEEVLGCGRTGIPGRVARDLLATATAAAERLAEMLDCPAFGDVVLGEAGVILDRLAEKLCEQGGTIGHRHLEHLLDDVAAEPDAWPIVFEDGRSAETTERRFSRVGRGTRIILQGEDDPSQLAVLPDAERKIAADHGVNFDAARRDGRQRGLLLRGDAAHPFQRRHRIGGVRRWVSVWVLPKDGDTGDTGDTPSDQPQSGNGRDAPVPGRGTGQDMSFHATAQVIPPVPGVPGVPGNRTRPIQSLSGRELLEEGRRLIELGHAKMGAEKARAEREAEEARRPPVVDSSGMTDTDWLGEPQRGAEVTPIRAGDPYAALSAHRAVWAEAFEALDRRFGVTPPSTERDPVEAAAEIFGVDVEELEAETRPQARALGQTHRERSQDRPRPLRTSDLDAFTRALPEEAQELPEATRREALDRFLAAVNPGKVAPEKVLHYSGAKPGLVGLRWLHALTGHGAPELASEQDKIAEALAGLDIRGVYSHKALDLIDGPGDELVRLDMNASFVNAAGAAELGHGTPRMVDRAGPDELRLPGFVVVEPEEDWPPPLRDLEAGTAVSTPMAALLAERLGRTPQLGRGVVWPSHRRWLRRFAETCLGARRVLMDQGDEAARLALHVLRSVDQATLGGMIGSDRSNPTRYLRRDWLFLIRGEAAQKLWRLLYAATPPPALVASVDAAYFVVKPEAVPAIPDRKKAGPAISDRPGALKVDLRAPLDDALRQALRSGPRAIVRVLRERGEG